MTAAKRTDAGSAVAGLFARTSATGGLAGRPHQATATADGVPPRSAGGHDHSAPSATAAIPAAKEAARLRLGVELDEEQIAWLRTVSRPARTGAARTLGANFVATGLLTAAIQLAKAGGIDMYGITAGDHHGMAARAHDALIRASLRQTRSHDSATDRARETTP